MNVGFIGLGRMGSAMVRRLLRADHHVTVYNRTRSKAEPLIKLGARLVDHPADLADRQIVIMSVSGSNDFADVLFGPKGLLADGKRAPSIVVDT